MTARHRAHLRQLSGDPTGTGDIREDFLTDVRGRFRRVRGLVRAAVGYEHDVFKQSGREEAAALAPDDDGDDRVRDDEIPEGVYEFDTQAGKVAAFMSWLGNVVSQRILQPVGLQSAREGTHWTAQYVDRAYDRGFRTARNRLRQAGVAVGEELDPFNLPKPRRQLRKLYSRTYRNLESVTADVAEPVRETLTEGLAKGENPRKIARRLTNEIESVQRTRAEVLARTEIINSYSDATLDRFDRAGQEAATVSGEFATADDERVCPVCEAVEGTVYTTAEMRTATFTFSPSQSEPDHLAGSYAVKPPVHPQCRCTILPVVN
jgi:phage putative head morphogenesis protein, SPP1 gp7 family